MILALHKPFGYESEVWIKAVLEWSGLKKTMGKTDGMHVGTCFVLLLQLWQISMKLEDSQHNALVTRNCMGV